MKHRISVWADGLDRLTKVTYNYNGEISFFFFLHISNEAYRHVGLTLQGYLFSHPRVNLVRDGSMSYGVPKQRSCNDRSVFLDKTDFHLFYYDVTL